MQEFRLQRAWCPHGRPPGRRRLDLDTDHGAFPVWEWLRLPPGRGRPVHPVHANVGPGHLGLSADLAADLRSWAAWHDRQQNAADPGADAPRATDDDWRRWRDTGTALAARLADETGAEVVHLGADGPQADCPHCAPAAYPRDRPAPES